MLLRSPCLLRVQTEPLGDAFLGTRRRGYRSPSLVHCLPGFLTLQLLGVSLPRDLRSILKDRLDPFRGRRARPPSEIPSLLWDWAATHAVGGALHRSKQGVSGSLVIYDRSETVVFRQPHPGSRHYFDLLGDMLVDSYKFLSGQSSRPALVQHMRQPSWVDGSGDRCAVETGESD